MLGATREHVMVTKQIIKTFIIAVAALLTSCDPMKTIRLTNATSEAMEVTLDMHSCPERYGLRNRADTLFRQARLLPGIRNERYEFYLGIGQWDEEDAEGLQQCIDKVIIKRGGNRIDIAYGPELATFIEVERTGSLKHELEIKIIK